MKELVDHILRPSLPWRPAAEGITECGYDSTKVKVITRDEFFQRLKDCGQQRTAILTCMTCSDTARRWRTWDQDPRQAMSREITWEIGQFYSRSPGRGERLKDELIAIATLVDAHREEFDAIVLEREQRRDWIEKKQAAAQRAKISATKPKPRGL